MPNKKNKGAAFVSGEQSNSSLTSIASEDGDSISEVRDSIEDESFYTDLEAEKIIGTTKSNGELMYLIKWKDTQEANWIQSERAKIMCPQIVIKFYKDIFIDGIEKNRNNV